MIKSSPSHDCITEAPLVHLLQLKSIAEEVAMNALTRL